MEAYDMDMDGMEGAEAGYQDRHLINLLSQEMSQQQDLIASLRREVDSCREEVGALRDCLQSNGVVDGVRFLVHLHRRRFNTACAAYGIGPCVPLDFVIDIRAVAMAVGSFAGYSAMRALSEASQAARPAAEDALCRLCPGQLALSSVERLDPHAGVWEVLPPMTEARQYTCAGVMSGKIYVCGGWAGPQPVRSVECYDPSCNRWSPMPSMLVARWGAGAGVINKRLFICGGLDESRQPLNSVECFSPPGVAQVPHCTPRAPGSAANFNGSWQVMPAMAERRGWPAAVALQGLLYVCGGRDEQREPLSSVERLNISPSIWLPLPNLSSQRAGASAAACGGRLYVCGGAFGAQMLNSVERFDPKVGTWETLPPMSARRAYVAAAAIAGGIHVFGGSDGGQCLLTAERFDPVTGTWIQLPDMNERRSGAASIALMI
ncbi:unnamed protein product [Effrenium voratum]|uniref:Uncharacterized protein n=1 Tax=Effrenium voratum TaxID=2562239 RepID=A0AA36MX37_9DINO|nr:unnamed protein product [Effrenium voratum]